MANRELERLYKKVRFFIGIKAASPDGKMVVNSGITYRKVILDFQKAAQTLEKQCRYAFPEILKKEGVCFKEITGRDLQLADLRPSFCPADDMLQAVMLDDVEDNCGAHVLVETSPGNWQGHFLLSRPASKKEATCVIRMLRSYHDSDPGAAKVRQGRRFITGDMRSLVDWSEDAADVDHAVKCYSDEDEDELELDDEYPVLTESQKDLYRQVWERRLKNSYSYLYPHGNKSAADFGLAMYILDKGLSPGVAGAALIHSRQTLSIDKGSYALRYVQKTVGAAWKEKLRQTEKQKRLKL